MEKIPKRGYLKIFLKKSTNLNFLIKKKNRKIHKHNEYFLKKKTHTIKLFNKKIRKIHEHFLKKYFFEKNPFLEKIFKKKSLNVDF